MGVSLGFYRDVEVEAANPHVRSPVIGVCSLRLSVDFGWQDLSQIGQQRVPARVFGFRFTGAFVLIDVPILPPVVGVCGPYPARDLRLCSAANCRHARSKVCRRLCGQVPFCATTFASRSRLCGLLSSPSRPRALANQWPAGCVRNSSSGMPSPPTSSERRGRHCLSNAFMPAGVTAVPPRPARLLTWMVDQSQAALQDESTLCEPCRQ